MLPPFLTFKESSCTCVTWKVSLPSRMRNMWSFISDLGRAQLLSCSSYFGISIHRGQLQLLSLGPIYLPTLIQRLFYLLDFLRFIGGKDMLFQIWISVITWNDRHREDHFPPLSKVWRPPKELPHGYREIANRNQNCIVIILIIKCSGNTWTNECKHLNIQNESLPCV